MSWFKAWLGYGLGRRAAKAIFGEDKPEEEARPPIRPQTEAEIRADEKRYEEDAKRLDAEDESARRRDAG